MADTYNTQITSVMFSRLLALFVIVPALELYLLIKLGTLIGAGETFAIILLTGIAGSYLAKSQGLSVWNRLQTKLASGGIPGQELLDGVIILVSGALLITPGVITDVMGLLGLLPLTRGIFRTFLKKSLGGGIVGSGIQFGSGIPFGSGIRFRSNRPNPPRANNGYQENPNPAGSAPTSSDVNNTPPTEPEMFIQGTPKKRPG